MYTQTVLNPVITLLCLSKMLGICDHGSQVNVSYKTVIAVVPLLTLLQMQIKIRKLS